MKAQNIFLDENTGGKGRYFKARILQPGLVKYSFGVCLLEKETIDKFVNDFVGCPVIIGHQDVTNQNADKLSRGNICHVWYDDKDGWYWVDGIIDNQEVLNKIDEGYSVSCQYEITEYSNNTDNKLHNGNPYDKVILNGKPEHLAIVETPRYESAMIAVNAIDMTGENENKPEEKTENQENITDFITKAINELKDTDMFKSLFRKKEQQEMNKDEMKQIFAECLQEVLIARNEEDEEKEKAAENEDEELEEDIEVKEDKAKNKKCKNEDVDKREIIRQIMAIAGKEEASEDVKTIAKLAEKLAYDKSEAGTADNGKKAKCEDEEEDKEDKEDKEEAKNKAKNAIDDMKGLFTQSSVKRTSNYVTQSDAIDLGNQLF